MAGAKIEIQLKDAEVKASLASGAHALSQEGFKATLRDIGEYMLRSTRDRAARELDPDGRKWRALSPPYAKWKAKKRPGVPILKFDFHMLGDQFSYQVDEDSLLIGTSAIYGAVHQFVGDPPRAWLGISSYSGDREEITQITLDHIRAAIEGESGPETPAA